MKEIKNYGPVRGTLKYGKKGEVDPLLPIFERFLRVLAVPWYNTCCSTGDEEVLPVSYNKNSEELKFYSPDTKEWEVIPTGGGGSPLTVSNFEGSIPNVTDIYVGNGLELIDGGSGNVTINAIEGTLQEVTDEGNTTSNDIEITDNTKGIILHATDNPVIKYRITVDSFGVLTTTLVP